MEERSCLLQCGNSCLERDSTDRFTTSKWENIKKHSEKWQGLDTFGSVFTTVDWTLGPAGHYIHTSCYLKLSTKKKLEQAELRRKKIAIFERRARRKQQRNL